MKNLVMSYKACGFMMVLCVVIVVVMAAVDGTIASATVVNRGTCSVGSLDRAGARATSIRNNLRSDDIVLTLVCDGKPYVTAQGTVIVGWFKVRTQKLYCAWSANGVAECDVPLSAEVAK
jgi:hypothetical protein